MLNYPVRCKKILYLTELDWGNFFDFWQSKQFVDMFDVIYCKSEEDARITSEYWRKPTIVVENFNLEGILDAESIRDAGQAN